MTLNKSLVKRIFGFAIVGGIGTIVNAAVLYTLTEYIGLYYILSAIIATEIAIINNFLLNDHFVFGSEFRFRSRVSRFIFYQVATTIGAALSVVLLAIFTEVFGVYYMYSYLISVIIVFSFNFITNNKFTWKRNVI